MAASTKDLINKNTPHNASPQATQVAAVDNGANSASYSQLQAEYNKQVNGAAAPALGKFSANANANANTETNAATAKDLMTAMYNAQNKPLVAQPQATQGAASGQITKEIAASPYASTQAPGSQTAAVAGQTTPTTQAAPKVASAQYPAMGSSSMIDQINAMYDAQLQAQMSQLQSAYDQNLSDAEAAMAKIAPQYQQSANDLAVQFERNRRNYNQQALANGMNTGTASQARLAQNNEYLRDFGQLRTAESNAMTEAERGITDLKAQYQSAIAAAAADNDYKRAAALMQEYTNQYNRDLAQAQLLAQYGDFSMYEKLYGKDTAKKMAAAWVASNPDLAYRTGQISAAQYAKMTGVYPAGYSPARSGGGGNWTRYNNGDVDPETIKMMQDWLVATGRGDEIGAPDGKYGPKTQAAFGGMSADDAAKWFEDEAKKGS